MPMSARRLYQLARDYKAKDTEAKDISKAANEIKSKVLAEMVRRGDKQVKSEDGVSITYSEPSTVVYDYDSILAELSPRQRKAVTVRRIDPALLSRAVQDGVVDSELIQQHTHVQKSAAYVTVTIK